jgi:hypothetical protein
VKLRRPYPSAGALARAKALVLEAGVKLPFDDWSSVAILCDTAWLPTTRRVTLAAARAARRRLYPLSAGPTAVAATRDLPRGQLVHVRGVAGALPGRHPDTALWHTRTVRAADGVWLLEEGNDFLLADAAGDRIIVSSDGGHLVNGEVLRAGDPVSVFGVLDDVPDRGGLAQGAHGRSGLVPALRSGEQQPLLLSRLQRYDQEDVRQ